eukprot:gene6020-8290_t
MTKRIRADGHLSKEEYGQLEDDNNFSTESSQNEFSKATPSTLASRRMVTANRVDRKAEFAKHIQVLNKSFYDWFQAQFKADPCAELDDGFQDYVDHVTLLEDRYLRSYGEVLTFGSGDCGQLAHGVENDEDLMVRFPRVVYSLRDKKVCGISCGGIHNAVYTESGQVFTWGCADDGTLGRLGDESIPLLVESLVDEVIVGVACGDGQTMAVSATGEVWGWGAYKDKEGKKFFSPPETAANPVKEIKTSQAFPIRITGLSSIVEVACGSAYNIAKSSDGFLYSWGIGEFGELGRYVTPMKKNVPGSEEQDYDLANILKYHITPAKMTYTRTNSNGIITNDNIIEDVKSFGCGSYHSLVVVIGSVVYGCESFEGYGIISVTGGVHHSMALSSNGTVYAFGRSDSGQIGSSSVGTNVGDFVGTPTIPSFPISIQASSIACGGNHNIVLTSNNEVYSWGYGDMLQLGHGDEKDEILPKKLNFTKAKIRNIQITQVAGGGQHSAIIGKVVIA